MKRLANWLAILSLLSVLNYIRINSPRRLPLFGARLFVQALSPILMVMGGLAVIFGWRKNAKLSMLSGMLGAILAGFYIEQATHRHDGFERAFGVGWQEEIDVAQRKFMLRRRYQWILPYVPQAQIKRDVLIDTVDGDKLLCDIWRPPAYIKPSGVAMIYLHWSGWYYLDKGMRAPQLFTHLAAQGHICVDVAYRTSRTTDASGTVGDVYRTIAWLKANASEYGIDPERIILCGSSAGGHLALLTGFAPDHPDLKPKDITVDTSVRGIISLYGVADLRDYYQAGIEQFAISRSSGLMETALNVAHQLFPKADKATLPLLPQETVVQFIGGTPEESPERYDLFSPIHHVNGDCPPTLILHGEHDLAIRVQTMRDLADKLRVNDVQVIYNDLAYTEHGFDVFFPQINPSFKTALFDIERFLALLK